MAADAPQNPALLNGSRLIYQDYQTTAPNPYEQSIWSDDLPGDLPNPAHTFLFSGPPLMAQISEGGTALTPIGFIQDITHNSSRAIRRVGELGHRNWRLFSSRCAHEVTLSRVMSRHVNLLGALYHWYLVQKDSHGDFNPKGLGSWIGKDTSGYITISPDSNLTQFPIGLALYHLTEKGEMISGEYWEQVVVAGLSKQITANGVLIVESIQLAFVRSLPLTRELPGYDPQSYVVKNVSESKSDS